MGDSIGISYSWFWIPLKAVEAKLEELVKAGEGGEDHPEDHPPPDTKAEEALRYL